MRVIWRSFAAIVALDDAERARPAARANADSACVSFGKHEPP